MKPLFLIILCLAQCVLSVHGEWSACGLQQQQQRIQISTTSACLLKFVAGPADNGSTSPSSKLLVVQGAHNSSLGRPTAVALAGAAEDAGGAVTLAPGITLLLQDLLLLNVTLSSPNQADPSKAFLPADLELPSAGVLMLQDVVLVVSEAAIRDYITFLRSVPRVTSFTDNTTFLHVRNYSNAPFGVVAARSLTLVAPRRASVRGTPLTLLAPALLGSNYSIADTGGRGRGCSEEEITSIAQQQRFDRETVAAACGDAAGIITVTDSYVLGANNSTMVPLLQQLASGVEDQSRQPLLVLLQSNVTFASKAWGSSWPAGGVVLRRPVAWVGSSTRPTSVDFGMEVAQVVLPSPSSNLTMFSIVLENLPYGDAASLQEAEGNSIVLSNRLWPIRYKRSDARLVLHDVVLVIPEQSQINGVIYWVNAFNSELEFWRNRTTFLRDTLKYTEIKYTLGSVPGDYVIITALSKDQMVWNVTYTTRPQVAAPLQLPVNASLHRRGSSNLDPQLGAVRDVQDLVLALWNQRTSACTRPHILLPANNQQQLSLAPAHLSLSQQQVRPTAGSNAGSSGSSGSLSIIPESLAEAGLHAEGGDSISVLLPNGTNATWNGSTAKTVLPPKWPPPGGEPIDCPATIRGFAGPQKTVVDVAFTTGLFAVSGPTTPRTDAPTVGAAATADAAALQSGGVLRLEEVRLVNLPQGEGVADAVSNGSRSNEAVMPTAPGLWISLAPRHVFTHLLWFIDRNLSSPNGPSVLLSNVTLLLPPQEAAQLAAMAAAAAEGVAPGLAQFQLSFPSSSGLLPMVYRNVALGAPAPATPNAAAASAPTAAATGGSGRRLLAAAASAHGMRTPGCGRGCAGPWFDLRRKLLQAAAPPATPPSSPPAGSSLAGGICVGQMDGAGIVGRDVCMVPAGPEYQLPPGYYWPQDSASAGSGSNGWPAWKVAVVVAVLAVAVLAAALLAMFLLVRRKRKQTAAAQALQAEAKRLVGVASTKSTGNPSNTSNGSSRRIPAGSNGGGGSGSSSNDSGTFARLQALARLYDCCPGQGTLSPPGSSAAAAGAAFTTAAAASRSSKSHSNGSVWPTEGAAGGEVYSNSPTFQRSTESAGSGSVVVCLGEQLGQLAATHMASLDFGSGDESDGSSRPTPGFGSFTVSGGSRGLRQQGVPFTGLSVGMPLALGGMAGNLQPQAAAAAGITAAAAAQGPHVANDDANGTLVLSPSQHQQLRQQLQQQAPSQLQRTQQGASRISSAISNMTADLQLQRLNRYANSSVSGMSGQPSQSPRASLPDEVFVSVRDSSQKQRRSSWLPPQQEIQPASEQDSVGHDKQLVVSARRLPKWQSRQDLLRAQSQVSAGRGPTGSGRSGMLMTGAGQLHMMEVIGAGSFGVVYRACWRGIPAAVKVMQLPVFEDEAAGAAHARSPTGGAGLAAAAVAERRKRGGINRREQMAVMEAALGSSLSHPNILTVYTYLLRPLTAPGRVQSGIDPAMTQQQIQQQLDGTSTCSADQHGQQQQLARQSRGATASRQGSGDDAVVTGYELQLVMEYCPLGSLRAAIDNGLLEDRLTRCPDYLTVLTLALGVAHAMNHLHSEGIVHGDLKAGNVLLKAELQPVAFDAAGAAGVGWSMSTGGGGLHSTAAGTSGPVGSNPGGVSSGSGSRAIGNGVRHQEQLVAKVADFGLACRLRDQDTHVSGVHRGTLNHMAPEMLLHGHASRASDVYAFGILLWEMATGMRAFANVPKALVAAVVLRDQARPEWPDSSSTANLVVAAAAAAAGAVVHEGSPPMAYRELAAACWAHEAHDRPSFDLICTTLGDLLAQEHARQAKLSALIQQQPATVHPPEMAAALQQQQQQGAGRPAAATPRPADRWAPASSAGVSAAVAAGPGRSGAASRQPFSPFAALKAEPFASCSVVSLVPLGSRKGTTVSSQELQQQK